MRGWLVRLTYADGSRVAFNAVNPLLWLGKNAIPGATYARMEPDPEPEPEPEPFADWYTTGGAAIVLGVHRNTVLYWVKQHGVPGAIEHSRGGRGFGRWLLPGRFVESHSRYDLNRARAGDLHLFAGGPERSVIASDAASH